MPKHRERKIRHIYVSPIFSVGTYRVPLCGRGFPVHVEPHKLGSANCEYCREVMAVLAGGAPPKRNPLLEKMVGLVDQILAL